MASIVNVRLIEGDETSRTWQITTDETPLNLSAVTVTAIIKPHAGVEDDDDTAHHLSEGDGLTVVDAAAGKVKGEIPVAVTQAPGKWLYKIVVDLGDDTETAIWGYMQVADA
ncbi:hypothetical protein [Acrocarpospora sp. B8E8]|uniref:hypothetical protein n=1 Tax=Acrocarpospora sp. B8E8 TaxID=3153572 RepID=UPI00325CD2BD